VKTHTRIVIFDLKNASKYVLNIPLGNVNPARTRTNKLACLHSIKNGKKRVQSISQNLDSQFQNQKMAQYL
jgi:hypothetical protein